MEYLLCAFVNTGGNAHTHRSERPELPTGEDLETEDRPGGERLEGGTREGPERAVRPVPHGRQRGVQVHPRGAVPRGEGPPKRRCVGRGDHREVPPLVQLREAAEDQSTQVGVVRGVLERVFQPHEPVGGEQPSLVLPPGPAAEGPERRGRRGGQRAAPDGSLGQPDQVPDGELAAAAVVLHEEREELREFPSADGQEGSRRDGPG